MGKVAKRSIAHEQKLFFIVVVVLIILSGVIGYQIGLKEGVNTAYQAATEQSMPTPTASIAASYTKCQNHGYAPKEDFLKTYTVKSGDSLLSIVKTQLGDPSRLDEVLAINKDTYPELSIQSPFLEVGSKLLLPTVTLPASSGNLREIQGMIIQIDPNQWIVQSHSPTTWSGDQFEVPSNTKYMGKQNYKIGDCVSVIVDINNGAHAIVISPQ